MTAKDLVKYWFDSANRDFEVAIDLYKLKRYSYCLFFCQLAIEKLVKGLVYKNTQHHPFPIHNIKKLTDQAMIIIPKLNEREYKEITSWNLEARYDSYKHKFYKKATQEFALKWFKKAQEVIVWLKNQY